MLEVSEAEGGVLVAELLGSRSGPSGRVSSVIVTNSKIASTSLIPRVSVCVCIRYAIVTHSCLGGRRSLNFEGVCDAMSPVWRWRYFLPLITSPRYMWTIAVELSTKAKAATLKTTEEGEDPSPLHVSKQAQWLHESWRLAHVASLFLCVTVRSWELLLFVGLSGRKRIE